jgi:hypothetical protein
VLYGAEHAIAHALVVTVVADTDAHRDSMAPWPVPCF